MFDFCCVRCSAKYKSQVEFPDRCKVCGTYDYDKPYNTIKNKKVDNHKEKIESRNGNR
ncbi:MAG: hypothetical protein WC516_08755 [Patescibacteria group bacterium]|jgi:hypothetical protein